MKLYRLLLTVSVAIGVTSSLSALDLNQAAGDFVCASAKEKGKGRLAVFPLTDTNDDETAETSKATTRLMGAVAGCGLNVIDQSKVKHVLDQQAMGESGIIDAETAPEVGKMTGADALTFGATDGKSIQIRLVDAATGEVIGAGVIEVPADGAKDQKGNPVTVKVTKVDNKEAAKSSQSMQLRQALHRLYKKQPKVYAYVVSTDAEIKDLEKKKPAQHKAFIKMINNIPAKRKAHLDKLRARVIAERAADKAFNDRVVGNRRKLKDD